MRRTALFLPVLLLMAGTAAAHPGHADLAVAKLLAPPGASASAEGSASSVEQQRYPWLFPRATTDRPDERTGRMIHVVFVLPAGGNDDRLDEFGVIEDSMRSQNVWMKQQTGNQQWRLDTYTFEWDDPATEEVERTPVNAVDVTFIRSDLGDDQLDGVGEVQAELESHGLNSLTKRYLSYVASNAGGVCGDAWYPISVTGPVDGRYSDIYLNSSAGCRARDFAPNATSPWFTESIAMQEMVHNDAMVPLPAPHDCLVSAGAFGHVCTGPLWLTPQTDPEATDVMFPYVGLPLSAKFLDSDHLDYYRHPFPYNDLEQSYYLEVV